MEWLSSGEREKPSLRGANGQFICSGVSTVKVIRELTFVKLLLSRRWPSPITTYWFLFFSCLDGKRPYLTHDLTFSVSSREKMFCFCSKPDVSLSQLPSSGLCVDCPLHTSHSSFIHPCAGRKVIPVKALGISHAPFSVLHETALSSCPKPSLSKRESDLTQWLLCFSDKLTKMEKEALRMSLDD